MQPAVESVDVIDGINRSGLNQAGAVAAGSETAETIPCDRCWKSMVVKQEAENAFEEARREYLEAIMTDAEVRAAAASAPAPI